MAETFVHHVDRQLPTSRYEQQWDTYQDTDGEPLPLITSVVEHAVDAIHQHDAFDALPPRNQELVLDMAAFMLHSANFIIKSGDNWRENFWGLYIIGGRARGDATPESDLDLLSVGTFYRNQGFRGQYLGVRDLVSDRDDIFEGFEIEAPDKLPDEYNVGDVDRKYLLRATPYFISTSEPVLPVDLNVVDLTFIKTDLEHFKTTMDVDDSGAELPRIPLVEVTVPSGYC